MWGGSKEGLCTPEAESSTSTAAGAVATTASTTQLTAPWQKHSDLESDWNKLIATVGNILKGPVNPGLEGRINAVEKVVEAFLRKHGIPASLLARALLSLPKVRAALNQVLGTVDFHYSEPLLIRLTLVNTMPLSLSRDQSHQAGVYYRRPTLGLDFVILRERDARDERLGGLGRRWHEEWAETTFAAFDSLQAGASLTWTEEVSHLHFYSRTLPEGKYEVRAVLVAEDYSALKWMKTKAPFLWSLDSASMPESAVCTVDIKSNWLLVNYKGLKKPTPKPAPAPARGCYCSTDSDGATATAFISIMVLALLVPRVRRR